MNKVCQYCGKVYTNGGYKYCSDKCKDSIKLEHNANKGCVQLRTVCIDCNGQIEHPAAKRLRCNTCQTKQNRQNKLKYYEKHKNEVKPHYIYKKESVLGDKSRMPNIIEIVKHAAAMNLSYGEYVALMGDNKI